jgi:hypothetical protein
MWNLSPFYLNPTRVYATHDFLEDFDHFLCRPIHGMMVPVMRENDRVQPISRNGYVCVRDFLYLGQHIGRYVLRSILAAP